MTLSPIEAGVKLADTMIRRFSPEALPPAGRFHYHHGVFLSGLYELYLVTGKTEYYDYVKQWIDLRVNAEGEISGYEAGQLDDIQPGILLYPLLNDTGDVKYRKALDFLISEELKMPTTPEGGFWHTLWCPNQMWLDGLYMGGPICVQYAKEFGRPELFDLAVHQAVLMEEKTRDAETGLMYHVWDETRSMPWADPVTGHSPEFWGRAMGWVGVALLNELDYLPAAHSGTPKLQGIVRRLLTALIRYQSADGRWYQVVNKPDGAGNWKENSCTCLYTAALAKGVRTHVLPQEFIKNAQRGFDGVVNSLTLRGEDAELGSICIGTPVGDYTHYINRPTTINDLHGAGAFLIMASECARAFR